MPKYMLLTITGGFTIGGGTENEATFRTTSYQLSDDISMIKGKHQIAFGVTTSQWRSAGYANVRSPGQFTIDGSITGAGLPSRPKCCAKRSASMVAEVTINFRSGRCGKTRLR